MLVGGMGTRLRAVVSDVPKPLAPVAGRPFLAWVLDRLAQQDVDRVMLATGYMADLVESTIGRAWKGMQIDYSVEAHPLGTGGAIRQAATMLAGEGCHVLNGDTWIDFDMAGIERAVGSSGALMGVALAHVEDVGRYGAVECDGSRVVRFHEKGGRGSGLINAGAYYLTPSALAALPEVASFSFETQVLVPATATGRVVGYKATAGFIDIGVPEDYARAQGQFSA